MRLAYSSLFASVVLLASATAFANPRIRRGPTSPRLAKSHAVVIRTPKFAGIEPARATQIQSALVRAGYMTGEPSGTWDATTQAAMEKMQADNGWQTKLVPDARAIIKLGLGPGTNAAAPVMSESNEAGVESGAAVSVPAN